MLAWLHEFRHAVADDEDFLLTIVCSDHLNNYNYEVRALHVLAAPDSGLDHLRHSL